MRSVVAITCLLLSAGLCGCTYAVLVTLSRSDTQTGPLTATEVREAAEIAEQTGREFGLWGGTEEPAFRECSEKGNCEGRMIAFYGGSVALSIIVYKSIGRIVITIRDRNTFTATEPTNRLEEAIKIAFAKSFPSFQIEVQRHVEFPALAP